MNVDVKYFNAALSEFLIDIDILKYSTETECLLNELRKKNSCYAIEPEMPRLNKWISEPVVSKCLILKYLIKNRVPKEFQSHFLLGFASILHPASNMKLSPHAFGSNKRKEDAPGWIILFKDE